MRKFNLFSFLLGLTILMQFSASVPAMAWGERGHHMICEVATRLVQDPELKNFLSSRGHVMGHLCNIPDIYWRGINVPTDLTAAAHEINPENAGLTPDQVPTDLAAYLALDSAGGTREARVQRLGTLWWRANQFFDRAVQQATMAKTAAKDKYDAAILEFTTNLGLMGHFVGDASQPLHNTYNYDGWLSVPGHGGLHSFYESVCVNQMELGVEGEIYRAALNVKTQLKPVLEAMKAISTEAYNEIGTIESLDRILTPSVALASSKPGVLRKRAERNSPDIACPVFRDLLIADLARAAAYLAHFWNDAYLQAGKPKLSGYHSYEYPLTPALVPLDYLP